MSRDQDLWQRAKQVLDEAIAAELRKKSCSPPGLER